MLNLDHKFIQLKSLYILFYVKPDYNHFVNQKDMRSNFQITSFLVLSSLAAIFAMFPMVLGIVGATSSMLDDESLLAS